LTHVVGEFQVGCIPERGVCQSVVKPVQVIHRFKAGSPNKEDSRSMGGRALSGGQPQGKGITVDNRLGINYKKERALFLTCIEAPTKGPEEGRRM